MGRPIGCLASIRRRRTPMTNSRYNARMFRQLPLVLLPFFATLAAAQTRVQDVI